MNLCLMLLVPLFAVSFCGSGEAWARGTAALLIGGCLIIHPPRIKLPLMLGFSAVVILLLTASAFLPVSAFPPPEWRTQLQQDYRVPLSSTVSAQPWVSLESWMFLLTGLAWLIACLGSGFSEGDRRRLLQWTTVAISFIAVIVIVLHYLKVEVPFWRSEWRTTRYFGPFPNRNNFSGLLGIGAVLALATALDAYRRNRLSWLLFGLALTPVFLAVLLNTSRMGIILFFLGVSSWMFIATIDKRSIQRMAVGSALLMLLAAFFILFGQHIISRFTQNTNFLTTISGDGRVQIFSDTFALLATYPWLGVGLGHFESIFVFFKTHIPGDVLTRSKHPENDWLWFAAETGLPALFFTLAAFAALLAKFKSSHVERRTSSRKDRRLRNACAISVGLLAIQGLVDTPLHSIGLTTLGALMAGLALNPRRTVAITGRTLPMLCRALGVVCLFIGFIWLTVAAGKPLIPGTSAAKFYAQQSQSLMLQGDHAAALDVLNKAVAIRPLQWSYYFDRAQLKLRLGYSFQEALNDFSITRFLEPNHAALCIREMEIWMQFSPPMAMPAAREAMRRDPNAAYSYYQSIISHLVAHPELRPAVRDLATNAKLKYIYLSSAIERDFQDTLHELLADYPSLECFTAKEKLEVFRWWYARGNREELIARLESNVEWRQVGWPVLAAHYAAKAEFEKAVQMAFKNLRPPVFASTRKLELPDLERSFLHNTTDVVRGLELYEAQKGKGLLDPALSTLRQIAALPKFPDHVHYEIALILYRKKEYAKAWEALNLYMSKVEVLSP